MELAAKADPKSSNEILYVIPNAIDLDSKAAASYMLIQAQLNYGYIVLTFRHLQPFIHFCVLGIKILFFRKALACFSI